MDNLRAAVPPRIGSCHGARRQGIEVAGAGYSAGRAYVILQAPSTGVTFRAWTPTLVAGAVSNAVVALVAFACWLALGPASNPSGVFLFGVFAVELLAAIANLVPVANNDGRQMRQTRRVARSPADS